jgi:hypothetical protein
MHTPNAGSVYHAIPATYPTAVRHRFILLGSRDFLARQIASEDTTAMLMLLQVLRSLRTNLESYGTASIIPLSQQRTYFPSEGVIQAWLLCLLCSLRGYLGAR